MTDPRLPQRPAGHGRALLGLAVLAASAAGGFVAYRLARPPVTLYPSASVARQPTAPPVSPVAAAAADEAGAAAEPAPRKIPEVLPDIMLPALDQTRHRLGEWRGRPLLVNFWATWCEPCRREIPLLKSLRRERSRERLEIVGIAIDFRDAAQKYAREHGMDYPVLVGEQGGYEAVAAFGMEAVLPFSVFADADGKIVTLKVGELHRDEADLILDSMRDEEQGRLSLKAAREQIAAGIQRLSGGRPTVPAAGTP